MKTFCSLLTIFFVVVAFFACSTSASDNENLLFTKKTGMVTYACKGAYAGKSINIYYHIPDGNIKNMPVQIIMHGMNRNGDKYRDCCASPTI